MNKETNLEHRQSTHSFFLQTRIFALAFLTGFLITSISLAIDKLSMQEKKILGVLFEKEFSVTPAEIIVGAAFLGTLCFVVSMMLDLKLLEDIFSKKNVEINNAFSKIVHTLSRWSSRIGMSFFLIVLIALLSIASLELAIRFYNAMFVILFFLGLCGVLWVALEWDVYSDKKKDLSAEERAVFRWIFISKFAFLGIVIFIFTSLWFITPILFAVGTGYYVKSVFKEEEIEKNNAQGNQN